MKRFQILRLALVIIAVVLCGCTAVGPSLRSAGSRDAKIVVAEDGRLFVLGEYVPLQRLHEVIAASNTEPNELIMVQLPHYDMPQDEERIMRLISHEMTAAHHYKYAFTTPPKAYTQTYNRQTGVTEVFVSGQSVSRLETVEDKEADIRRLEADNAAFQNGTYVSDAAEKKPISVYKEREKKTTK